METRNLDSDIVRLYTLDKVDGARRLIATLFWGDTVNVVRRVDDGHVVRLVRREYDKATKQYDEKPYDCLLPAKVRFRDERLLKVRVVDVAQGDGAIVETPRGQVMLIDGGEESHMLHYLNAAYSHVLHDAPLHLSAIVVTHGDADHFAGLTRLVNASRSKSEKRPLVTSERVYHNGLVKRPSSSKDLLGRTESANGEKYCVELEQDLRAVDDAKMNKPFLEWKGALEGLRTREGKKPVVRRIEYGDEEAFDFLATEKIGVKVLGPIVERVNGKPGLPFLHDASHTINGHSIVLKLSYGNVRFLFGADLNNESEERLLERARRDNASLTADILKVPHHGSADFSPRMLEAVSPVVSVISSGDESSSKEYIHPRAGLVGALGRYSRGTVEKPLVYVTEMVAFFARLKETPELHNAYQKKTFGIVHVRTDGERVLVVTNSGKDDQKESYAFRVDRRGDVEFEPDVKPI